MSTTAPSSKKQAKERTAPRRPVLVKLLDGTWRPIKFEDVISSPHGKNPGPRVRIRKVVRLHEPGTGMLFSVTLGDGDRLVVLTERGVDAIDRANRLTFAGRRFELEEVLVVDLGNGHAWPLAQVSGETGRAAGRPADVLLTGDEIDELRLSGKLTDVPPFRVAQTPR